MRNCGRVLLTLALATLVCYLFAAPVLAAPGSGDVIHIVQRGENLTLIAMRYGVTVWSIARSNGITNPNHIYVGQRLVIPGAATTEGSTHIVRRGETLTTIGWRYGIDPWTIARANKISNLNLICVGQALVIPGSAPSDPAPKPLTPVAPEPDSWLGPWTAEYFANAGLTQLPALTRTDQKIAFNWGYSAPAPSLPPDRFSVRWTGTFRFDPGAYRFFARVDDGVRVFVDELLVIDGWRHGSTRTYSALVNMTAGDHQVVVEYYDYIQVARAYVWATKISGPAPADQPEPLPAGWMAEFFNNESLAGEPVLSRVDPWIGFEWGTGEPAPGVWADGFSVRWTNKIALERDHYRFCAMSDDGVRIWVADQLVVDHWHANNGVAYCGVFYSTGLTYPVKVEYYEHGGNALIYVWWEPH